MVKNDVQYESSMVYVIFFAIFEYQKVSAWPKT